MLVGHSKTRFIKTSFYFGFALICSESCLQSPINICRHWDSNPRPHNLNRRDRPLVVSHDVDIFRHFVEVSFDVFSTQRKNSTRMGMSSEEAHL